MRCLCCNRNLSDYESVLKHPETGHYLDICVKCLVDIPVEPVVPERFVDNVGYADEISDENTEPYFFFEEEDSQ
jgi:hypothetical protein